MASKTCRNCGGAWPHEGKCPAHGKQYRKCQKPNHFARVCQGQLQRQNQPGRSTKHQHKRERAPINAISKVDSDTDSSDNRAQQQRRIPYHIRDKVKSALEQLEKENIIERVPEDEPTPWVSTIVAVPKKDGGVRICVDMRAANEAIKRVHHRIPTVKDISFELNGATCFSKLDLSQAYHQLELDEASRYITTFSTHVGLFRYKRLNYGTNAAAEIFQYTLQTQLQGLTGVKNIADDILVYGIY